MFCAISRLCGTIVQSQDCAAATPVCNLEITQFLLHAQLKFQTYMKVKDIRNKLLQLRHHHQCRACILKPPHQGLLGSLPTRINSLRSGYRHREIPDLWSATAQGITISESSQLSSACQFRCALTLSVHYMFANSAHEISRLCEHIAQSRDCANLLRSVQIGCAISRLACNFQILRMHSSISRLRKFLACAEHIYCSLAKEQATFGSNSCIQGQGLQ